MQELSVYFIFSLKLFTKLTQINKRGGTSRATRVLFVHRCWRCVRAGRQAGSRSDPVSIYSQSAAEGRLDGFIRRNPGVRFDRSWRSVRCRSGTHAWTLSRNSWLVVGCTRNHYLFARMGCWPNPPFRATTAGVAARLLVANSCTFILERCSEWYAATLSECRS